MGKTTTRGRATVLCEGRAQQRCPCIDPNSYTCLARRWQISGAMSECLNGCNCPCHTLPGGSVIPPMVWELNKQATVRHA